jgi:hypothetical protein
MAKDYQSAKEGLIYDPREILVSINNALVAASNADFPPSTTKEMKNTAVWRSKLRQYGRELASPAVESVEEKLIRSQDLVFLLLDRALLIQAKSMALEKMPFGLFDLNDPALVGEN